MSTRKSHEKDISDEKRLAKNKRIKEAGIATRNRRASMQVKVFDLKIVENKLSKTQKEALARIFLEYKCALAGIEVVITEENYTSKCNFLDDEPIQKHSSYSGRRVKRGLFKASDGTLINADLNGALNILKKQLLKQEAWNDQLWSDCVEVCARPGVSKVTIR